ncbi:hypothetical protein [Planctomyces sp. SH-PL62]|uniref:hypothetical protein n=1 Tax=Planctomyces sp. SH-PL62 TaxID=1636152 RepID=UPI00078CDF70|nr:hypothetical protein [Planctomyces sp. SH-PL62]AMV37739.1 hypothetical protein VT85_09905 [Planctomyces sp. SH-PL62]
MAAFKSPAHDDHDDSEWGLCKDCKWWQIEPEAKVEDPTLGLCIDEDLLPYNLRVSGLSGCNHFMAGEPARAAGSAEAPPHAKATR